MANVDRAKGFVPVRHFDGSPFNGQHEMMLLPTGDSTATFIGDVVNFAGSAGTAGQVVAGQDVEGMPTIARNATGTTGQAIAGVVMGFLPDPTTNLGVTSTYRLASTARIALVVVDPTVLYEVQEDAVTSNLAAADVNLNISHSTTAGSTTTGLSGMQIISNAKATTSTLPFRIYGLVKRPDNAFGLASTDKAKFLVYLNTSQWAMNIAGA